MQISSAKDLAVYKEAYQLAMEIFEFSKTWPREEKFSLIDQARRSSRSVCTNLREAWSKRRYEAHCISKLTDADGENSETDTWLDFAKDSGYLAVSDYEKLVEKCNRAVPPETLISVSRFCSSVAPTSVAPPSEALRL